MQYDDERAAECPGRTTQSSRAAEKSWTRERRPNEREPETRGHSMYTGERKGGTHTSQRGTQV